MLQPSVPVVRKVIQKGSDWPETLQTTHVTVHHHLHPQCQQSETEKTHLAAVQEVESYVSLLYHYEHKE